MEPQKQTTKNIGKSLVESLWTPKLSEMTTEFGDIALDAVFDEKEGFLKEIPIFGWFVKSYGAVINVRDRLFLKKVANFLYGTSRVPEQEREKFQNKMESDSIFSQKVGESLVLLLDRHEDFEKSLILGKIFAGYMKGAIDDVTFSKLANIIDRAFISDLKNLENYYSKLSEYEPSCGKPFSNFLDDATCQSLYTVGLIRAELIFEDIYHPNEIGQFLVQFLNT
ncbi:MULTISPECIES: hypothetical protein [unclassified Nodularia (in: cyanobacteria)]|uniref:hypothetical protein n=1 Tax=unclassified Nodularia (in: cyanobacteria) TaxID=2656917 RepID=UPI001882B903|nr:MULTISPECIES: hypothetical protein [unclassified Nodularia (in: cyanobacteria)]MBE9197903.1 hypothetical protein [Nodularia sp. LEGE 06071]MCC2693520.1 hypothetical protein [Nodularia sp. LEGE 04288]